jgi:hypothetical protein
MTLPPSGRHGAHELPTLSAGKPCAVGAHCDNVGGDASNRFKVSQSTGDIYYTGTNLRSPAPGHTLPPSEQYDYSVAYRSSDNGKTFAPIGVIGRHIAEVDILPLPPASAASATDGVGPGVDELLASIRYQQSTPIRAAGDPPPRTDEYWAGFYKQTGVSRSTNGGVSWSEPGVVTGYLQQTGSLAMLQDGTIVLAFGHKDDTYNEVTKTWVMYGQRAIFSHDRGHSFSRTIYELHAGAMYAATVALPAAATTAASQSGGDAKFTGNQTLVSVCANSTGVAGSLHVLRWQVPPRSKVAAGGYFSPVAPSCGASQHQMQQKQHQGVHEVAAVVSELRRENERLRQALAKAEAKAEVAALTGRSD